MQAASTMHMGYLARIRTWLGHLASTWPRKLLTLTALDWISVSRKKCHAASTRSEGRHPLRDNNRRLS